MANKILWLIGMKCNCNCCANIFWFWHENKIAESLSFGKIIGTKEAFMGYYENFLSKIGWECNSVGGIYRCFKQH